MSELGKRSMPLEKMSRTLVLFDVDGTLTAPREEATKVMKDYLMALKERVVVGIVGGSDLPKQKEQMGENIVDEVDYSFSENGLVAYKAGSLIGKEVSTTMIRRLTAYWLRVQIAWRIVHSSRCFS
jgi:hydroxymethylpyrimidine pyrophosphatase-like HAD family hydrolase